MPISGHTELLLHTTKLGIAPFGLTLMPEVTVIVININAMAYGGESAVAAYAVIAYMAYAVQALIQGVGDGSQPLVSQYQGAGKFSTAAKIRNTNFAIAIAIGLVSFLTLVALRDQIPLWFGASAAAAQMVSFALPLIAFAYLFFGFTHVTMAFFYATDNAQGSSVLVYGEAVLVAVLAATMGSTLGLTGVWCAIASAQLILSGIALCLLHRNAVKRGLAKRFSRRARTRTQHARRAHLA